LEEKAIFPWPYDEGLWRVLVNGVTTVEDTEFVGRGAGWLDDWEMYLRLMNKMGNAESFLTNPTLIESGYISWVTAIFRFVTPIKNKPSPQQLLIGNWVPEDDEITQGIWYGLGATIKLYFGDYCGRNSIFANEATFFYIKALELFGFDSTLIADD